jgi:hypothetical protein
MERMQARVRRIRRKVNETRKSTLQPDKGQVPGSLSVKYHIGKTQNNPMDLGLFLHEYRDDPAVSVVVLHFQLPIYITKCTIIRGLP